MADIKIRHVIGHSVLGMGGKGQGKIFVPIDSLFPKNLTCLGKFLGKFFTEIHLLSRAGRAVEISDTAGKHVMKQGKGTKGDPQNRKIRGKKDQETLDLGSGHFFAFPFGNTTYFCARKLTGKQMT